MTYNTMAWFLVFSLFQLWICAAVLGSEFQKEYYRGLSTYYDLLPMEGILRTMVTNSLVVCGLVCLRDSRCQAFFYDGRNCHAYSNRMSNSVSTTPAANMIYYEKPAPRVKEIGRFNIRLPLDYFDCLSPNVVYLPDGRVVVLDLRNTNMKMFTDGGQYMDQLTVSNVAMCVVDNNTVAIIDFKNCRIRVVNVGSSKLVQSKTIDTLLAGKYCRGMTYSDGMFVVSTGRDVYSVTDDGTADFLHTYDAMSNYIANDPTNQGQVLVSHGTITQGDIAVSRLVLANKQSIDVLRVGVVQDAEGIDVDVAGNIYVLGYSSHNVILMSPDGSRVWELLTSSDTIYRPSGIDVSGDKFVFTSNYGADKNYIRVFQVY